MRRRYSTIARERREGVGETLWLGESCSGIRAHQGADEVLIQNACLERDHAVRSRRWHVRVVVRVCTCSIAADSIPVAIVARTIVTHRLSCILLLVTHGCAQDGGIACTVHSTIDDGHRVLGTAFVPLRICLCHCIPMVRTICAFAFPTISTIHGVRRSFSCALTAGLYLPVSLTARSSF